MPQWNRPNFSSSTSFTKKRLDVALIWPEVVLWPHTWRVYLHIHVQFITKVDHRGQAASNRWQLEASAQLPGHAGRHWELLHSGLLHYLQPGLDSLRLHPLQLYWHFSHWDFKQDYLVLFFPKLHPKLKCGQQLFIFWSQSSWWRLVSILCLPKMPKQTKYAFKFWH